MQTEFRTAWGEHHRTIDLGALNFDLVLQTLSYMAQTERENIRQRQREGIDSARVQGSALTARSGICRRISLQSAPPAVRLSIEEVIRSTGLLRSTFYRKMAARASV